MYGQNHIKHTKSVYLCIQNSLEDHVSMGAIDLESANRQVTPWPIAVCTRATRGPNRVQTHTWRWKKISSQKVVSEPSILWT